MTEINKAAEEGELPEIPEAHSLGWNVATANVMGYTQDDMKTYAREAIAADRASRPTELTYTVNSVVMSQLEYIDYLHGELASRQGAIDTSVETWMHRLGPDYNDSKEPTAHEIAMEAEIVDLREVLSRQVTNKAEIEPFGMYVERNDGSTEFQRTGKAFQGTAHGYKVWTLYAAPPGTTGASTAPVETFIELRNHVAKLEAELLSRDVSDHVAKYSPASTVLTDERIHEIMSENVDCSYQEGLAFARAIEREVAAQAGQVAVPEGFVLMPKRLTRAMQHVLGEPDWEWADFLAAAEVVTEEEYNELIGNEELAAAPAAPAQANPLPEWRGIKAVLTNLIAVAGVRIADKDEEDEQLITDAGEAVRQLDARLSAQASTAGGRQEGGAA